MSQTLSQVRGITNQTHQTLRYLEFISSQDKYSDCVHYPRNVTNIMNQTHQSHGYQSSNTSKCAVPRIQVLLKIRIVYIIRDMSRTSRVKHINVRGLKGQTHQTLRYPRSKSRWKLGLCTLSVICHEHQESNTSKSGVSHVKHIKLSGTSVSSKDEILDCIKLSLSSQDVNTRMCAKSNCYFQVKMTNTAPDAMKFLSQVESNCH